MFTGILGGLSLVLVRSGSSSLTGKSREARWTHDNRPRWLPTTRYPLPESIALMPRLRLLARFLLMIYSWSWKGALVLTSNSSVPKLQLL